MADRLKGKTALITAAGQGMGRAAVLAFMGQAATDPVASNDAYVSWRFPYLIALILDSVYHTMR